MAVTVHVHEFLVGEESLAGQRLRRLAREAAAGQRADGHHGREWMNLRAVVLREVQIVLDQRVLGVVTASGHALATLQAGIALGSDATEERVADRLAGR